MRRKVRTPTGSRLDNIQAGEPDGKCNRKQTASGKAEGGRQKAEVILVAASAFILQPSAFSEVRVKGCGKSAPHRA